MNRKPQPLPPLPTYAEMTQKSVSEYVLEDINERIEMGKNKYGTKLMVMNTRDSLWDAYEEVLDLAMYLRQTILRQELCECGHRREDHVSQVENCYNNPCTVESRDEVCDCAEFTRKG